MKRLSQRRGGRGGFTLVEIMLVVIIIGVLAAMVVPSLAGHAEKSRITAAKADIKGGFSMALDLYEQHIGAYPTTAQGLAALTKQPEGVTNWQGPYLKEAPVDPWTREYHYTCPGVKNPTLYDLVSYGRDGKEGGGDDIANYDAQEK